MTLAVCLAVSATLFAIGAFGLLTRRNMIAALMSMELMVNAALINFVAFARFGDSLGAGGRDPEAGSIFALFAVAVTAAEMALALAIVVALHRRRRNLDIVELDGLHG
ncbi:MAG TPA: NADH-quinone oxidoreductase subunit NuoK [Fibrobacteria bacterium]|nr:NADH-quinone oxidoreductase subunit NuoK [Fibrobacteria bacterium]